MPQRDFMAKVHGDIAKVRNAMTAVFRESAQRTIGLAQTPIAQGGNMPVRTGFLRASGQASLSGVLGGLVDNPDPDGSFAYDAGAVSLVIASAELEDTITFAYTARYAAVQEYKNKFIGLAAQRWPQTVDQVATEARARMKG